MDTVVTSSQPVWAQDGFVRAVWVASGEAPEWIAARTDAVLNRLQPLFGIASWQTYKGDHWGGSPEALADIVRRFVVRDRPTADNRDGAEVPAEGYSFIVSGIGPGVEVDVRVAAGSVAVGRRTPRHTLSIDLRQTVKGTITSAMGDGACAAIAETWKPSTLSLADTRTTSAARRGGWKIGVGYRTWISSEVGTVAVVAEGLTATELASGTMISAPDDWAAERVVDAMTATLRDNGLDEVPH